MQRWSIFSITRIVALMAGGWLALSAVVMALSDAAPGALVPLPSAAFLEQLPKGVAITNISPYSVTLASADAGLTRKLYGAGAWLVLPDGLEGCLPPPDAKGRPLSQQAQSPTSAATQDLNGE